jgi:hypothetical protein
MFAIGNDELARCGEIGNTIKCHMCGKRHKVKYGEEVLSDGTKVPSKTLAFYKCNGKDYLAGIEGKDIRSRT